MKNLCVNKALCIGCGACCSIDNEHFSFDDDGTSKVINNEIKELSDNLKDAISSCPTNAIKLEEK